jgi:transporter family-2 protein
MNFLFLLLIVLSGAGLTVQIVWNARLRVATASPILAVLISLCVSILATLAIWVSGYFPRGSLPKFNSTPAWSWFGGLFAVVYLVVSLVAIPRYGAAIVIALVVTGQMAAALFLDSTGMFGVHQTSLTIVRVLGALLIILGVILIQIK